MDYIHEKNRLSEYLRLKNITYDQSKKTWRCINHEDGNPSAVLYENADGHVLWCPVCQESWNIFAVCSKIERIPDDKEHFGELLKSVRDALNIPHEETVKFRPFPEDKKEDINNQIKKIAEKKGKIKGSWKYKNIRGETIALDVRFEKEGQRKEIITFWYSDKLEWTKTPVFLYGLELLDKNKPVIIHEGAKCSEIGYKNLPEFNHVSWSGGSGRSKSAPWHLLNGYKIFILPDNDTPGKKAAEEIKKCLTDAIILPTMTEAKSGDIEQILQILTPEEITEQINSLPACGQPTLNPLTVIDKVPLSQEKHSNCPQAESEFNETPYKVLGIGDDGRAAFITEEGRLQKWNLDGMSRQKLAVLAGNEYWRTYYPAGKNKIEWDDALDDIIRESQRKDFNEKNVRGRGAWRDGDNITYHDGINTYGHIDKNKIYLRLPLHDIGINDKPASVEIRRKIKDSIFKMSFETPADAVRCLAWSTLAPFAGALPYRPSILLTGPSGSGKTTVANLCIRKLADCEWFNGSESTVAGVRGKIKYDSRGVVFEETENDTIKKSANRDDLFSLMRVSVSDDAPDTVKGTKDGGYNSFKMQNMFGFIAIDPTIESVADENRIFRINMQTPKNKDEWSELDKELKEIISDENCCAIRAHTWNNLQNIFDLSKKIIPTIMKKTGRDYRSSFADSMLVAVYVFIWMGEENPTSEQINAMLDKYYSYQQADEHRDEAAELVDRLLDETIEIIHDHGREKITIIECMNIINTGQRMTGDGTYDNVNPTVISNYKLHVARYGIRVMDDGQVAVVNNNHNIKKIIGVKSGYSKIFRRHPGFVDNNRSVWFFNGKIYKSTVFNNLLVKQIIHNEENEIELDFI